MLDVMKKFFQQGEVEGKEISEVHRTQKIQVATCALLLEVAHSDDEFSEIEEDNIVRISGIEEDNIVRILKKDFNLSEEYAQELMALSEQERKESIDLWSFTRLINENYSLEEKIKIIEMVWKVIYADGKLDKYEDHLAHKLSKLLKLEHKQLINTKLKVRDGEHP
jgi:uncharacterized tellurite resistance protein B-like protein